MGSRRPRPSFVCNWTVHRNRTLCLSVRVSHRLSLSLSRSVSLSLSLCVCVCVCRLSLRQSNEKLAQPPEHLSVDPEHLSIDDALSGAVRRPLRTDSMGPADSVYTASPLDVSVALGME